jgi:hypothetical protein
MNHSNARLSMKKGFFFLTALAVIVALVRAQTVTVPALQNPTTVAPVVLSAQPAPQILGTSLPGVPPTLGVTLPLSWCANYQIIDT